MCCRLGPSPRVRGSPAAQRDPHAATGSIPAGAGKPLLGWGRRDDPWVHPRGCGEAHWFTSSWAWSRGPSPRVRGSHRRLLLRDLPRGSIPAGAGKPRRTGTAPRCSRVHPRGCGEARGWPAGRDTSRGPSPRVRGSQQRPAPPGHGPGSIPAGAGKPGAVELRAELVGGPSPRVRGSRRNQAHIRETDGSIPAGAGKPTRPTSASGSTRVHPRGCGEA